jgi:predicted transcriptional regulator
MRTLHIRIEEHESAIDRLRRAARKIDAGVSIRTLEGISFATIESCLSAITPRRLALASQLNENGPLSIRKLSTIAGRDYKTVYQDVQKLIELGLIEKREDGLIEAPYDRIVTDMRFTKPSKKALDQSALFNRRSNEARKKRVRLERT